MKISIAIPDSALSDEVTKVNKSRKISAIARACAIFKIQNIFIYEDAGSKEDRHLLVTILKYMDTPQFLRKQLFPKINELKYAGALSPLKIPSHTKSSDPKKIKEGDVRDGIVIYLKKQKFLDIGIDQPIPYHGKGPVGKRVIIYFKKGYPDFVIKEISKEESPLYWGYKVKERGSLFNLLTSWKGDIILTSRKGKKITPKRIKDERVKELLVVFGSPSKGIHEILGNKIKMIQNSNTVNFFPNQGTETVRLEEAIIGTLATISFQIQN